MFTLTRAKRTMRSAGEPLPDIFPSLAAYKCHLRRGQLHLIAAGPGVGKSVLAQTFAMKTNVPALYFSADSDAFTMYLRGAAMVTGHRLEDIESDYAEGRGTYYDEHLDRIDNVRFDFTSSPGAGDLENCVNAFALTYGEYPHLIVVDNLINLDAGELVISEGQRQPATAMQFLKDMASKTGAAIVTLHHLVGQYDNGTDPAPLSALIDKVSKLPEVVLTLHRGINEWGKTTTMGICVVKNRSGESDPSGHLRVYLDYAPGYARLEELQNAHY